MPSVASVLVGPSLASSTAAPSAPPLPVPVVLVAPLDPLATDELLLDVAPVAPLVPGFGTSLSPEQAAENAIRTRAPADGRENLRIESSLRRPGMSLNRIMAMSGSPIETNSFTPDLLFIVRLWQWVSVATQSR